MTDQDLHKLAKGLANKLHMDGIFRQGSSVDTLEEALFRVDKEAYERGCKDIQKMIERQEHGS